MTVTVEEKFKSRQGQRGGTSDYTDLVYLVKGTDDDAVVYDEIESQTPAIYDGLKRLTYDITDQINNTSWEVTVRYGRADVVYPSIGDASFSFDTGGESEHITNSIATSNSYAAAGSAPDFKGAIGVTGSSVDGVTIGVKSYNFVETYTYLSSVVTEAYRATIAGLTNKVNSASFRGFAAGEVLFLGASGASRDLDRKTGTLSTRTDDDDGVLTMDAGHGLEVGSIIRLEWNGGNRRDMEVTAVTDNDVTISGGSGGYVLPAEDSAIVAIQLIWDITFKFAQRSNQTGLEIGDLTGIAKKGWEYLWVRYEDVEDGTANAIVKRPKYVYVEQVYNSGDFSGLGVG